MGEDKKQAGLGEQRKAEYHARMERLKQVAGAIDRGPNDKYFGADFHLGFNFLVGEIEVLQTDPDFSALHDRLSQILQSSEAVLLDSISPVENNKRLAAMADNPLTDNK